MSNPPDRPRGAPRRRVLLAIAVVAVLLLAGGSAILGPGLPTSARAASTPATLASGAVAPATVRVSGPADALPLSPASAGSVVATAFVNYNASAPGNFPGSVVGWAAGAAAVDPTNDQLWIPEVPTAVDGIAAPASAPALIYTASSNSTEVLPGLANTSAIAFDPLDGDLYATDPINNTVLVIDPTTHQMVHAPIPVGTDPSAILYDPISQHLFVANEGSDNVTVLSGTTGQVLEAGVSTGIAPIALADDVAAGKLFVADSGSFTIWVLNTTTYATEPTIPLIDEPGAIAFSASQDILAVGMPAATHMDLFDGSDGAVTALASVGSGVSSIATNPSGTDFLVANGTGDSVAEVGASTGTIAADHPLAGRDPSLLTLDPTSGVVYAWSRATRIVTSLDPATGEVVQASPDLGARAAALAYDPASDHVLVADTQTDSVEILNASSFLTVRTPVLLPGAPNSLADDPGSGIVYAGFTGGVAAIDAQTGAIEAINDALPSNNTQLVFDNASDLLWEINNDSGLQALNPSTLVAGPVVGLDAGRPNLNGVTLDPATNELFVVDRATSALVAIDGTTGAVVGAPSPTIPGLLSVAYDPADGSVYAAGASVWAVDPVGLSVEAGPIPIAPHTVAWSIVYEPSREFLYVSSNGSLSADWAGNLTVIDGSSVAASEGSYATIPVGQLPLALAAVALPGATAPGSSEIWAANFLSGTVSVIASPPEVTSFSATPDPVDAGSPTNVSLDLTGGAGASTVSYVGLPYGCVSSDATTFACAPAIAGTYPVTANVSDSLGFSVVAALVLNVSPALTVGAHVSSGVDDQLDFSWPLNASAAASGGTPPYEYLWNFGDASTATGTQVTHTYSAAGVYLVTVTVTDAGGGSASNLTVVTVDPPLAMTITAAPINETDVGVPIELSANVTGGSTPGSGVWSFGDGESGSGATVTHAYAIAGVYFAAYTYEDANGVYLTQYVSVVVNPPLSATPVVTTVPAGSAPTAGAPLDFNATVAAGTPPYTEVWAFDDGSYGYGIAAQHTYAAAGTYHVTLFVEDAVGAERNLSLVVVVAASAPPSSTPFDSGLVLGLLVGATAAAIVLFAIARPRKRPPSAPPTAYVPPAPPAATAAPAGAAPDWKES